MPSAAVVFTPPSRERDSLRVQLVCVFLFFFTSPLSLFCLFSSGKNTRVLTRAIFPFSWSARENPIVLDGSVCAEGDWESSPLCARARLVRERGVQRARKVGVGFVFFLPDLFHHPKLFPHFLDSYSTFYSAFLVFQTPQMHFTIANKLIVTLAGTGSGVGREVESEMKQIQPLPSGETQKK